ncbi:hypothetical protein BCO26_2130 [Heyndrickxia coagulans 2-6]|nr:hypothetical protein BCO26_2130 [Heyndrickxia coagulans 2-6]
MHPVFFRWMKRQAHIGKIFLIRLTGLKMWRPIHGISGKCCQKY